MEPKRPLSITAKKKLCSDSEDDKNSFTLADGSDEDFIAEDDEATSKLTRRQQSAIDRAVYTSQEVNRTHDSATKQMKRRRIDDDEKTKKIQRMLHLREEEAVHQRLPRQCLLEKHTIQLPTVDHLDILRFQ